MPQVPINFIAVLGAAVAGYLFGALWYGPLFGKKWVKLSHMSEAEFNAAKARGMGHIYTLSFVGVLLMSYVLAHSLIFANAYLNVGGISAGMMAGFWNWLGFVAPVTLGTVLWENKSWKLWIFNNTYQLLGLMIMGIILALW